MKKLFFLVLLLNIKITQAQTSAVPDLKTILLQQLHTTHDVEDWFVPANIALEGLTPEQAKWKDGNGNHSIGQLASHLIFWNLQQLCKFKNLTPPVYDGNNDETFNSFDGSNWKATVQKLDSVLTAMEKLIETTDETTLKSWYNTISHISTHNAYHIGQIIYIRKLQGSWNPEKGVK